MPATRFLTFFGVPVPPWRDRKIGAGAITIKFVVTGKVPSKKNNQQAVTRRKEAAAFLNELFAHRDTITKAEAFAAIKKVSAKMRGNDQYKAFLEEQRPVIEAQRTTWMERLGDKGLIFPISRAAVSIRFYFAQKYRQDSLNKQQSIHDLLKDCKIIVDDDYTCVNPVTADADCFAEDLTENIVVISLTFKLKPHGT